MRLHVFNVGVERESPSGAAPGNFRALRRDLAALPWCICAGGGASASDGGGGGGDCVAAPPPREAFLRALRSALPAGARLPRFVREGEAPAGATRAPYGERGAHLARSACARYRQGVVVCRSIAEVEAAIAALAGADAVLKAEYSSSGLGVRVCRAPQRLAQQRPLSGWAANCIARDGCVTVEPWMDIALEVTAEWADGRWLGVSFPIVERRQWVGQWRSLPPDGSAPDGAVDFVMSGGVEALLAPLQLPATCGAATCGADVAVVRGEGGGFEARLLEVNARTTMPHYARAAFAALGEQGGARAYQRFAIVDAASVAGALEDEAPAALCLTDPHGARFCACLMRAE